MSDLSELELVLDIIKETKVALLNNAESDKISFLRKKIREKIFCLNDLLLETYSRKITEYVIFPVLTYIDEKILLTQESFGSDLSWGLLQLEYYDRKDGGEYVYEIVDNLLSDKIYPSICYQVIHLIFESDFFGKFYENIYNNEFLAYKRDINNSLEIVESEKLLTLDDFKSEKTLMKFQNKINSNILGSVTFKSIVIFGLYFVSLTLFLF